MDNELVMLKIEVQNLKIRMVKLERKLDILIAGINRAATRNNIAPVAHELRVLKDKDNG
jgi:hypothetical protein